MHHASQLGEYAAYAKNYGWNELEEKIGKKNDWDTMRDAIQDYIKGLNFGYRVQLRDGGVTYLNKLGKFVDAHTLECTDAKGKTQNITGARFVIATGGRPSPLNIPGGEHAISSGM
jgi:pyruvate/2-oxoglutarate dehydrogenase complex dihydrolipoamide dehydrogenase (E3) component